MEGYLQFHSTNCVPQIITLEGVPNIAVVANNIFGPLNVLVESVRLLEMRELVVVSSPQSPCYHFLYLYQSDQSDLTILKSVEDQVSKCKYSLYTLTSPLLRSVYGCRYNQLLLLLTWLRLVIPFKDLASTTRWEIIKPAIDILHFLQSIPQDEGFQKWYWTQRSDYEYAMLAMNYASQNYPPNEQELLYPTLQVGRAIAKDWG